MPTAQIHPPRSHARRQSGFTLIEVIVVVVIIGVIATIIVPNLVSRIGTARGNVAQQKLANIEQSIQMFQVDYGRLPRELSELTSRPSDITADQWSSPSLSDSDLTDPWGNPWQYQAPGDHGQFDLASLGADGQPGGEGENADVTSWE